MSDIRDFTEQKFRSVLEEPTYTDGDGDRNKVTRILLTSGKLYYELVARKNKESRDDVAIVRIEQLAPLPGGVEDRAPNIAIPLAGDEEALWRGYDTRVRRWIRVAERSGLRVEEDAEGRRLDGFVAVYEHTMNRHAAGDWYYFPRPFFEAIRDRLPGQYVFFHALDGDRVVSSDLVLRSADHAYYFLGGTLTEAFDAGPNYLVKHHVARWAQAAGLRRYVLGGGYQPGDGVYRYKRGWTKAGEVTFRVACWTHDGAAARELTARRAAHAAGTWAPNAGFFPPYRA